MAGEARPVCVYTMASLKKNSTKLLVLMCIGIALALYGIYVQARSQSNPNYMPTLTLATHWLYHNVGQRIAHPSTLLTGTNCGALRQQAAKGSVGRLLMSRFVAPVTRYSGIMNGFINVLQILLLMVYGRSVMGADAIMGLSAFGLVVSAICLVGSFAVCKLMCISCLGIHHIVIIYLALRRRRLLSNIFCPSGGAPSGEPTPRGAASTFGSGGGGGGGGGGGSGAPARKSSAAADLLRLPLAKQSGGASSGLSAPPTAGSQSHSSSCSTRLRRPAERRS